MLGWEPETVTEYHYDDTGRLAGTVSRSEPEWSADDLRLTLAQWAWDQNLGRHGIPMDEATDPGADPNDYGNPLRFVVGKPVTDWAEKARLDAQDKYRKHWPDASMNGLIFPVIRSGDQPR